MAGTLPTPTRLADPLALVTISSAGDETCLVVEPMSTARAVEATDAHTGDRSTNLIVHGGEHTMVDVTARCTGTANCRVTSHR
jgi:hypothetical protein